MMFVRLLLLLGILLLPLTTTANTRPISILQTITIQNSQKSAIIILTFNQALEYHAFLLKNPHRLVIDLEQVKTQQPKPKTITKGQLIQQYRYGGYLASPNPLNLTSRLVFDIKQAVRVQHWRVQKNQKGQMLLTVELTASNQSHNFRQTSANWQNFQKNLIAQNIPKTNTNGKTPINPTAVRTNDPLGELINQTTNIPAPPNATTQTPTELTALIESVAGDNNDIANAAAARIAANNKNNASISNNKKLIDPATGNEITRDKVIGNSLPKGKPLIVIDAGHGGIDSGAIGRRGTVEKLINLAMAKELEKTLLATGRYRVLLTRKGDYFIPLRERYRIAEKAKADFFLSIHADSFPNPNVLGASVYTLSSTASDKETEKLAARENLSDAYAGISYGNFDVRRILFALSQRQTTNRSVYFAEVLARRSPPTVAFLKNNPHRFANFTVMKSPVIPSVLFEMGFLSSIKQEKEIISAGFRQKLAGCMRDAFDQYFYNKTMQKGCNR